MVSESYFSTPFLCLYLFFCPFSFFPLLFLFDHHFFKAVFGLKNFPQMKFPQRHFIILFSSFFIPFTIILHHSLENFANTVYWNFSSPKKWLCAYLWPRRGGGGLPLSAQKQTTLCSDKTVLTLNTNDIISDYFRI